MFLTIDGITLHEFKQDEFSTYKDIICDKENNGYALSLLRKMHKLRYETFSQQLNWTVGLAIEGGMEFDEFDNFDATYLLHINSKSNVDSCTRILYTDKPFLLGEKYPHFVTKESLPSNKKICETTRFAVNNNEADVPKLFQMTIAAMLVWGIKNNIENFVSLTTAGRLVRSLALIGWNPQALGPEMPTPDDTSVALKYSSTPENLQSVCSKSRIPCPNVFSALTL